MILLVIFGVALALRLGAAARFQGLDSPPKFDANPDQVDYELLAYHLSTGQGYSLSPGVPSALRPPGTALTLLPVYAAFGRSFALGRLWFCLLSAATCLATAWLARPLSGRWVAVVAAAWLAIYPGHLYYAMHFLSETPYGLYLTLACGFTLRALTGGGWRWDLAAGTFWALAVLTRPQTILVVPFAWLLPLLGTKVLRRPRLGHIVLETCVLAAVLAPWVARNAVVMGKPTLSTVGGLTFWGAHNDVVLQRPEVWGYWLPKVEIADDAHPISGSEVERDAIAWRYGWEFIRSHPERMPDLCAWKLWRLIAPFPDTPNRVVYWMFATGWLAAAPFVVVGSVLAVRRKPVAAAVLFLPVAATVVTTLIFYGGGRFRDSIAPVLVTLAALAAVAAVERLRGATASGQVGP